jgi:hypothetical protein
MSWLEMVKVMLATLAAWPRDEERVDL